MTMKLRHHVAGLVAVDHHLVMGSGDKRPTLLETTAEEPIYSRVGKSETCCLAHGQSQTWSNGFVQEATILNGQVQVITESATNFFSLVFSSSTSIGGLQPLLSKTFLKAVAHKPLVD